MRCVGGGLTLGKVEELAKIYEKYISIPWRNTLAGGQRVFLVVYDKEMERSFRARKGEFAQRTIASGHGWKEFDCTSCFAEWLAAQQYREDYFAYPNDLQMKLDSEFLEHVVNKIKTLLHESDEQTVVAVTGVGSLYGFIRITDLIRFLEPEIKGRLVVFFPGTKDGDNYRLLDARDGWNYLAQSITLHASTGGR